MSVIFIKSRVAAPIDDVTQELRISLSSVQFDKPVDVNMRDGYLGYQWLHIIVEARLRSWCSP